MCGNHYSLGMQLHYSTIYRSLIASFYLALLGCSQDKDEFELADSDSTELPSIPTICPEPAPELLVNDTLYVGSGTPESCNEQALRQALQKGGWIGFQCGTQPVTIQLESPIDIKVPAIVDGNHLITLDGRGKNRIIGTSSSLEVLNLRFINGFASGSDKNGGAITGQWRSSIYVRNSLFDNNVALGAGGAISVWTGSHLTVASSAFRKNKSTYGGAIYGLWSPLHIVNAVFIGNSTIDQGNGGAIGTDGALDPDFRNNETVGGNISICGSEFRDNSAYGAGGAAYIWVYPPDTVTIDRSSIHANYLAANSDHLGMGGGMRLSNGLIRVYASSFYRNIAATHGGALSLDCSPHCTIANSTFYADSVENGYGGAIFGNNASVNNSTFSRNYASGHGGAIFASEGWYIANSIFWDNYAGNPWNQANTCSQKYPGHNNLQGYSRVESIADSCSSNILSANPMLNDLADNGGPTWTLEPGAQSPALQAGRKCETADQRGFPRDTAVCDLGAIEISD